MQRSDRIIIAAVILLAVLPLAMSPWWAGHNGAAAAQELPPPGRYQCSGATDAAAKLTFTVGPGNIYTTIAGFRGTMVIHPGTGNILFRGAAPQNAYQGRYDAGPPPVALLSPVGGVSNAGIVCRMH